MTSHSNWKKGVDRGSTEGCTIIWTGVALPQNSTLFFPRDIDVIYRSRYSDWLQAGRPRGQSSSPSAVKNILLSTSPRLDLGPNQPPIQWVPEALSPGVKRPGRETYHSPPTSAEV
jgi:hypothetical protein